MWESIPMGFLNFGILLWFSQAFKKFFESSRLFVNLILVSLSIEFSPTIFQLFLVINYPNKKRTKKTFFRSSKSFYSFQITHKNKEKWKKPIHYNYSNANDFSVSKKSSHFQQRDQSPFVQIKTDSWSKFMKHENSERTSH